MLVTHYLITEKQREDPKMAGELKSMEVDYERRRHQMVTIYESVMQAQKVKLDDIPLPSLCMPPPPPPPSDDSMFPVSAEAVISAPSTVTPKSILKAKTSNVVNTTVKVGNKEPPGPPPGSPPSLEEFECEDDEYELGLTANEAYKSQEKPKKLRFDSQPTIEEPSKSKLVPPTALVSATSTQPMYSRVPPPPPPTSQSASVQYQQQIAKSIQSQMTGSRIVQQQPPQTYYHQQTRQTEQPAAQSITPATIFQAKPVLRNKMAEITRFTPTSLVVKRTDNKKQSIIGSAQQPSILSQQTHGNGQQGPYNYMLQQQQQYATLNPLNTYKSSLSANSNYSSALIPTQVQQQRQPPSAIIQPTPIISSNRPTATIIDPKDAAYDSFMKEIGKLL